MKKILALFLSAMFVMTSPFGITKTHANNGSYNRIENAADIPMNEALYTNLVRTQERVAVTNWISGIKHAYKAPVLVIELNNDVESNETVDLKLTNLVWFFRNTDSSLISGARSVEHFDGGIEKQFKTSFDMDKGKFINDTEDPYAKSGTYTGSFYNNSIEKQYTLTVDEKDDTLAHLIFKDGAKRGDAVEIPLITRVAFNAEATIEIISKASNIASGKLTVLKQSHNSNLQGRITAEITNPVSSRSEFQIESLIISENVTGSIENGSFMLSAPQGYVIVPDIANPLLKQIDKETLLTKVDGKSVIDMEISNGLMWNYKEKVDGVGEMGKDYTLSYKNPSGQIDKSKVIVEILNIIPSKVKDTGTIKITGLKLLADNTAQDGDVMLEVANNAGLGNLTTQKIIAGKKVPLGELITEKFNAFSIEAMPLEELIQTDEFKAKKYIVPFGGNIEPGTIVTRAEFCNMLYLLFADTSKTYENTYPDVINHKYENAIGFCISKGYITGHNDTEFLPNGYVTRGSAAIVLNNLLHLSAPVSLDVLEKDHVAYEAMAQLVNAHIISGYEDKTLRPDTIINRREITAMINRSFGRGAIFNNNGNFPDLPNADWGYGYMMNAVYGYTIKQQ